MDPATLGSLAELGDVATAVATRGLTSTCTAPAQQQPETAEPVSPNHAATAPLLAAQPTFSINSAVASEAPSSVAVGPIGAVETPSLATAGQVSGTTESVAALSEGDSAVSTTHPTAATKAVGSVVTSGSSSNTAASTPSLDAAEAAHGTEASLSSMQQQQQPQQQQPQQHQQQQQRQRHTGSGRNDTHILQGPETTDVLRMSPLPVAAMHHVPYLPSGPGGAGALPAPPLPVAAMHHVPYLPSGPGGAGALSAPTPAPPLSTFLPRAAAVGPLPPAASTDALLSVYCDLEPLLQLLPTPLQLLVRQHMPDASALLSTVVLDAGQPALFLRSDHSSPLRLGGPLTGVLVSCVCACVCVYVYVCVGVCVVFCSILLVHLF